MTTQNRDVHRSVVYRAEDQWSATLDRGGVVDFFGSVIDVPEQLRFGALEAVQTWTMSWRTLKCHRCGFDTAEGEGVRTTARVR